MFATFCLARNYFRKSKKVFVRRLLKYWVTVTWYNHVITKIKIMSKYKVFAKYMLKMMIKKNQGRNLLWDNKLRQIKHFSKSVFKHKICETNTDSM